MPRRSFRNLLRQFRQLGVDVAGKGAEVSDNVQLTYKLDDMTPARIDQTVGLVGTGCVITGVAGQVGILEVQVNNPAGIIIDAVHVGSTAGMPTGGRFWTTATQITLNNEFTLDPELRQGRAHEIVHAVVRCGTNVLATTAPVGAYRFASPSGTQVDTFANLFINGPSTSVPTQFVYMLLAATGNTALWGIRWRELADPNEPGIPGFR